MKILTEGLGVITHDGNILHCPEPDMSDVGHFFWGVETDTDRPSVADFVNLTKVNQSTLFSDPLVFMNSDVGWLIFVESVQAPLRTKWYINIINQGSIGGSFTGFDPNLFPDPVIQNYLGRLYRVYISSYITKLDNPIQFQA